MTHMKLSRISLALALALGLAFGMTSFAYAQAAQEPAVREGRSRFFDPGDGHLDLSYFLENPRGFLPIPIVVTEPAVGYGGGAAGMFLRPRREAGQEGWARPDRKAGRGRTFLPSVPSARRMAPGGLSRAMPA